MRKWLALWLTSLITVAVLTSALMRAQTQQVPPAPRILSGGDIGFRVEDIVDGRAVGTLMVRVDGTWVPTTASVAPKRLVSQ
jgi:hypothetical protein